MNLRFTLPDDEKELASAVFQGEPIVYCVPFDLHLDGSFCQNGWIVVTKSRLLVLTDGEITSNVDLAQMDEIICVAQVDNGVLPVQYAIYGAGILCSTRCFRLLSWRR